MFDQFAEHDAHLADDSRDYLLGMYSALDPIQEMANDDGCSRAEMAAHLANPPKWVDPSDFIGPREYTPF